MEEGYADTIVSENCHLLRSNPYHGSITNNNNQQQSISNRLEINPHKRNLELTKISNHGLRILSKIAHNRCTATFLVVGVVCLWTLAILSVTRLDFIPTHHDFEMVDTDAGSLFAFPAAWTIHRAQREADEATQILRSNDLTPASKTITKQLRNELTDSIVKLDFSESDSENQKPIIGQSEVQLNDINATLLGHSHDDESLHEGCEVTVMLVRHCEKGSIREHCDYDGFQRSVYLPTQFGDHHSDRWPLPSYIFALNPTGRDNKNKLNLREIEMVSPLAKKARVRIDDSYKEGDEGDLAKEILAHLKTGELCGKLVVISWKHSLMGHLARKLGCGPFQGCPLDYRGKDFDSVWEIRFVYMEPQHSLRKSLRLEKGASWFVYGSVQQEGFDPLASSKQYGDYPQGGTSTAGRWMADEISYPERKSIVDTSIWQQSNVGFGNDPED